MRRDSNAAEPVTQLKVIDLDAIRSARTGKGSAKTRFRPALAAQLIAFPADMESLLPPEHVVFSVISLVKELELTELVALYDNRARVGRPAYDSVKLLTLVVYCFMHGIKSCRDMQRAAEEWIPCRLILGDRAPHHSTVGRFLAKARPLFADIFQDVLILSCDRGLVDLEHVSIDGSKILANASKAKTITFERISGNISKLQERVDALTSELETASKQKKAELTKVCEVLNKRIEEHRKAKIILEQRAKDDAAFKAARALNDECGRKEEKPKKPRGNKRKIIDPSMTEAKALAKYSPTDPESRMMSCPDGNFEQAYNVQIAVDRKRQIIVANDVVIDGNDKLQLLPMLVQLKSRFGRMPLMVTADAGYCSERNLLDALPFTLGHGLLVAVPAEAKSKNVRRERKKKQVAVNKMRALLETQSAKDDYKLRKTIVEPVFGQIKSSVIEFDTFSWRGMEKAKQQWHLICAVHNMLKIVRADRAAANPKPAKRTPAA